MIDNICTDSLLDHEPSACDCPPPIGIVVSAVPIALRIEIIPWIIGLPITATEWRQLISARRVSVNGLPLMPQQEWLPPLHGPAVFRIGRADAILLVQSHAPAPPQPFFWAIDQQDGRPERA
jgi:hypothetical protein